MFVGNEFNLNDIFDLPVYKLPGAQIKWLPAQFNGPLATKDALLYKSDKGAYFVIEIEELKPNRSIEEIYFLMDKLYERDMLSKEKRD